MSMQLSTFKSTLAITKIDVNYIECLYFDFRNIAIVFWLKKLYQIIQCLFLALLTFGKG